MNRKLPGSVLYILAIAVISSAVYADDEKPQQEPPKQSQNAQGLDMVSDTVASVFNKANALLAGDLEITMSKRSESKDDYIINAMGQRVPRATAIKSGGALHSDQPL